MSDGTGPEGSWSADLLAGLVATGLAAGIILLDPRFATLRMGAAIALVLFLPGFALVSLLFPRWDSRDTERYLEQRRLGLLERVVLGVITSAAIVPAVAYGLAFSPYGLTLRPLLAGIAGLTGVLFVVAFIRRLATPATDRFRIPIGGYRFHRYLSATGLRSRKERPFEARTPADVLFNLALILSVLILLWAVAWAVATPVTDDSFTEVSLLAEDGEGNLVAEGHPAPGEGPVTVAIDNREGETRDYTVVVQIQDVDPDDGTVREAWEIDRLEETLDDGERATIEYEAAPDEVEGGTHLVFLVYVEEVPADPSKENAYRWVDQHISE